MNEEKKVSLLGLIDTSWQLIGGFSWASLVSDRGGAKQFAHDPTIAAAFPRIDLELLTFLLTTRERGV